MAPMKLSWDCYNKTSEKYEVIEMIYKNGDDMRQDMLVL